MLNHINQMEKRTKKIKQASWHDETIEKAKKRIAGIEERFLTEVIRLTKSGALDPEGGYNRAMVYGVALENIADEYLLNERRTKEYKNLKKF